MRRNTLLGLVAAAVLVVLLMAYWGYTVGSDIAEAEKRAAEKRAAEKRAAGE